MPMKPNKAVKTYNDGIAAFYSQAISKNAFGAETGSGAKTPQCDLHFAHRAMREQDMEYANAIGQKATMKIACPLPPVSLRNSNDWHCAIDGTDYDVIWLDIDRPGREIFFFLERRGDA